MSGFSTGCSKTRSFLRTQGNHYWPRKFRRWYYKHKYQKGSLKGLQFKVLCYGQHTTSLILKIKSNLKTIVRAGGVQHTPHWTWWAKMPMLSIVVSVVNATPNCSLHLYDQFWIMFGAYELVIPTFYLENQWISCIFEIRMENFQPQNPDLSTLGGLKSLQWV